MQPTRELIDDIYRDKVIQARRMSVEQKILAGSQLFEMSCRIMTEGIRNDFPDADEARVREIFEERLALLRRLRDDS
ncbi:MAG TPA: hypothetical protein VMV69_14105 [Pirellulales bacterium]|nr:hypothetical protein [Pirellulales bacterium]